MAIFLVTGNWGVDLSLPPDGTNDKAFNFYSYTNGSSWYLGTNGSVVKNLDGRNGFDAAGRAFYSQLAGNPHQFVYVYTSPANAPGITWTQFPTGGGNAALKRGTPVTFPDGSTGTVCSDAIFDFPLMTVGPSSVYVEVMTDVCRPGNLNPRVHRQIVARSSTDTSSWTDARVTLDGYLSNSSGFSLSVGPTPTSVLYVTEQTTAVGQNCAGGYCYTYHILRSADGGLMFQDSTVSVTSPTANYALNLVAADPGDSQKVYAAGMGSTWDGVGWTNQHVYVAQSTDGGATWPSPPVLVDDANGVSGNVQGSTYITISVSSSGRVDVAWVDATGQDVWYSSSTDNGQTFAADIRVTSVTAPITGVNGNDYLTIASDGNKAYVAYGQNRLSANPKAEIYVTKITH